MSFRRGAAAVLVAVLVTAGCGTPAADDGGEPEIGDVPVIADASDLKLPVQDYMPTPEQAKRIGVAQIELIKRCMARFGKAYDVDPVDGDAYGPRSLTDRRYGITDLELARADGYGLGDRDPARQPEAKRPALDADAETVLGGDGRSEVNGQKVPEGGCLAEAGRNLNAEIPEGADYRRGTDLQEWSFKKSREDSRVRNAFVAWSRCMAEAGYSYADPFAPAGDPAFAEGKASAQETAVAVADVGCKQRTNLVGIFYTVESAYQTREIDKESNNFDATLDAIAARDRVAAAALS
ncbi:MULTISPECIES: hypothetical protein [Catenuloplanes]|uniref:Uncharacterized protein n=1 Tax=Catenuloplanes niger TaxID=587534 RepID=A0AAE3ZWM5_9ACTN|nr:hypothetical protein [Catenuloplanes niger]MDR7327424.1 hypothetical protein [Catenuloplanes niger]